MLNLGPVHVKPSAAVARLTANQVSPWNAGCLCFWEGHQEAPFQSCTHEMGFFFLSQIRYSHNLSLSLIAKPSIAPGVTVSHSCSQSKGHRFIINKNKSSGFAPQLLTLQHHTSHCPALLCRHKDMLNHTRGTSTPRLFSTTSANFDQKLQQTSWDTCWCLVFTCFINKVPLTITMIGDVGWKQTHVLNQHLGKHLCFMNMWQNTTKPHTLHHDSEIYASKLRNAMLIFMPRKGPHL